LPKLAKHSVDREKERDRVRERVLEVEDKNSSQQRNVDQIVANKELFN
jgi:hypothetical protein